MLRRTGLDTGVCCLQIDQIEGTMVMEYRKLPELCKGRKIYIQTHNFPDPDAIASGFGLQKLFEYYGIESVLCYEGRIDKLSVKKMTDILDIDVFSYEEIQNQLTKDDWIICVDAQKNGGNIKDFVGIEFACIDHHPVFSKETYLYEDIRLVGSCATLIADYYKELDVPMDSRVATALLYGMRMDTMQFSRGVTELDIEMFAFLFSRADHRKLEYMEKNNLEFRDLRAYGAAIENIELYDKLGFASIPFSCPNALIAIVSDFILSLDEVEIAIIYSMREDGVKFSIRSELAHIHAGKMANQAMEGIGNGGGHAGMAGGLISKEEAEKLGVHIDLTIRERFIKVFEEMNHTS